MLGSVMESSWRDSTVTEGEIGVSKAGILSSFNVETEEYESVSEESLFEGEPTDVGMMKARVGELTALINDTKLEFVRASAECDLLKRYIGKMGLELQERLKRKCAFAAELELMKCKRGRLQHAIRIEESRNP